MEFIIDLLSIKADNLKPFQYRELFNTKPWSELDLSVLNGLDLTIDLSTRAKIKFEELQKGTVENFDVLDVLALTTIDNQKWQDKVISKRVGEHWWRCLLSDAKKRDALYASLIFCIYYQDKNFVNRCMVDSLIDCLLVNNKNNWYDKNLEYIVGCILKNNVKALAEFALSNFFDIELLFKKYPLPVNNYFKTNLEKYWLNSYLRLPSSDITGYDDMISCWLSQKNDIDFMVERAKQIFDNDYFSKDLKRLEIQTHKFVNIYQWLKKWSVHPSFKAKLDIHHLQILRCWIGAGNYYQLEKTVRKISQIHNEHLKDKGKNISLNRYFFWTNYQRFIVDYYLLLPKDSYYLYDSIDKNENIKLLTKNHLGSKLYPIIVLRFEEYYFIQPLVFKSPECELVMTADVDFLDSKFNQKSIDISELLSVEPCLIHDFCFGWQQPLVVFLKDFGIYTTSSMIKVSENSSGIDFEIDVSKKLNYTEEKDRKRQLDFWFNNSGRINRICKKDKIFEYAKELTKYGIKNIK